jgi:dTDP-4-dehydrorhamnose reductase
MIISTKKILILGGSGMLGKDLIDIFSQNEKYQVFTIFRNTIVSNNANLIVYNFDLKDNLALLETIFQIKPDIIINSAAITNIDYCEKNIDESFELHSNIISRIKEILPSVKFVYISTDSIFDGKTGNYTEEDNPNPLNIYAKSKFDGELRAMSCYPNCIIARTNIIGYHLTNQRSLSEWAIMNLKTNKSIVGFNDVYFNPLYTKINAKCLIDLIEMDYSGIINLTSNNYIDKYTFLVLLSKALNLNQNLIISQKYDQKEFEAIRPLNTTLNNSKLKSIVKNNLDIDYSISHFINDYKKQFN